LIGRGHAHAITYRLRPLILYETQAFSYGAHPTCDQIRTNVDSVLLSRPSFRSRDRDRDLDKMNSSALECRDHGLEITSLAASKSCYRSTHQACCHETKAETWVFRSRDRDLDKMNSSALESQDHGLEITSLRRLQAAVTMHTNCCLDIPER